MDFTPVEQIASAFLHEGYLLYPYRPRPWKNRHAWTFGALFPPAYCQAQDGEASVMQTECLIRGNHNTTLEGRIRFLHLRSRPVNEPSAAAGQDAIARDLVLGPHRLPDLLADAPRRLSFFFPPALMSEG